MSEVCGVVIAGGRSVRFGSEKALALYRGKPLLLWAVERLQRSCPSVAVNARPGTGAEALAREHGLLVLHDFAGDPPGPLSGVRAGLHWARGRGAPGIAVSPCDVPQLPADLFERLAAAAGSGAALVETAEGLQPMCAIWPVSALPVLGDALAQGAHPAVWRMLEQLGAVRVHCDDPTGFANINTPDDLARLAAVAPPR